MGTFSSHVVSPLPVYPQSKNMVDIIYLERERVAMLQSVSHLIDKENSRKQDLDREKRQKVQEVKDLVNRIVNILRLRERELIIHVNNEFEQVTQSSNILSTYMRAVKEIVLRNFNMLNQGGKGTTEEWRVKIQQINRIIIAKVCERGATSQNSQVKVIYSPF